MYYGYYYFDPTYILIIIGVIISLIAQANITGTYNKYAKVMSKSGMTGAMAAEKILRAEGIYDVKITRISGNLTDNFNPKTRTLNLSDSSYDSTSVAAIGIAAHECGHAVQYKNDYMPIAVRNAILPFANAGQYLSWILIVIGLIFFNSQTGQLLIEIGILAFSAVVLFQLVTLPVEFNASKRAVQILRRDGMVLDSELKSVKKVLSAAALTYVAAAISSILQLLRLVLLFGGRRRD